jgi:hypothetical protein
MKAIQAVEGSAYDARRGNAIFGDRIDIDSARLREEFLSMPALCLTVEQVARLLHLPVVGAAQLLADLERDGFVIRTPSRRYRLAEPFTC